MSRVCSLPYRIVHVRTCVPPAQGADMNRHEIHFAELPDEGFIRQHTLLRAVPFSSATLWRKVQRGEFPRPVKLGERITAWPVGDVRRWMADPLGFRQ